MQTVETKVKAATGAAAAGAPLGYAAGELACWLLDAHVLTPGVTGDLPAPVTVFVMAAVASGISAAAAFAAGYRARHTPRHAA